MQPSSSSSPRGPASTGPSALPTPTPISTSISNMDFPRTQSQHHRAGKSIDLIRAKWEERKPSAPGPGISISNEGDGGPGRSLQRMDSVTSSSSRSGGGAGAGANGDTALGGGLKSPMMESRMNAWRVAQDKSMAESSKATSGAGGGLGRERKEMTSGSLGGEEEGDNKKRPVSFAGFGKTTTNTTGSGGGSNAQNNTSTNTDTIGTNININSNPNTNTNTTANLVKRFSAVESSVERRSFAPISKSSPKVDARTAMATTADGGAPNPTSKPRPTSWVPKRRSSREPLVPTQVGNGNLDGNRVGMHSDEKKWNDVSSVKLKPIGDAKVSSTPTPVKASSITSPLHSPSPAPSPLPSTPRVTALSSSGDGGGSSRNITGSGSARSSGSPFGVTTQLSEHDPIQRRITETAEELRKREREIDETLARLLGRPMPGSSSPSLSNSNSAGGYSTSPSTSTLTSGHQERQQPYYPNPEPVRRPEHGEAFINSNPNASSLWETEMIKNDNGSPLLTSRPTTKTATCQITGLEKNLSHLSLASRGVSKSQPESAFRSTVVPPQGLSPNDRSTAGMDQASSSSTSTSRSTGLVSGSGSIASKAAKYGSLGKTDGRKLGKHLPRIASNGRVDSTIRPESTSSPSDTTLVVPSVSDTPTAKAFSYRRPAPPTLASRFQGPPGSSAAVTASAPPPSPSAIRRLRPDGLGMQGLTGKSITPNAPSVDNPSTLGVASTLVRSGSVTGVRGRIRLSRLPPAPTSSTLAPAPLPSKRLNTTWMDKQRKELGAYEYLCHVGEAQQWIEGCLGEELGFGVTEMEEGIRDGVALAKLARLYEGEQVVKHIWEDSKHRFKQSDNIVYFLNFVRNVGMPETFVFETTDLYNKRNIPKVIYCIHILSHLLARLGKADKIGNLVGQFDFTDEQLESTKRGLQGVTMPNFSKVSTALAKECQIEPEEEPESEEEIRDRLLLECEGDIRKLQALTRGYIARQKTSLLNNRLALTTVSVLRLQSRARGALARKSIAADQNKKAGMFKWTIAIQAAARRTIVEKRYRALQAFMHTRAGHVVKLQAQCRGSLVRKRHKRHRNVMQSAGITIALIQAQIRGTIARQRKRELVKQTRSPPMSLAVTSFQALARGRIVRTRAADFGTSLRTTYLSGYIGLQATARGALVRSKLRRQVKQLDDSTAIMVAIQTTARGWLARKDKKIIQQIFEPISPGIISLQAVARAKLARRNHADMQKSLNKVEVSSAVGGLQAMLRSRLAKRNNVEQKKQLDFVAPDVIGFQALARGILARRDYNDWLGYLRDGETQAGITFLQRLLRGNIRRRQFLARWYDLQNNMDNIIKVQAIWRGRREREKFRKVISGTGVDVAAVQHFMHLLDDSENDFNEERQIETLRKQVVSIIRENQLLEGQVAESDTRIALLLQNRLSFEDLVRVKRITGSNISSAHKEESFQVAHMDPFSHAAQLDKTTRHKLELYQHLFFLLQTDPKYLARLMRLESETEVGSTERKRMLQGVILALYGYGSGRREEFLLMKVLQLNVHEQALTMQSLEGMVEKPMIATDVAIAFARPKNPEALKKILGEPLNEMIKEQDLDLCIDPVSIYHRILNDEESESGVISTKPRDIDAYYAVMKDAASSAAFFQQMTALQHWTSTVLESLYRSTDIIPYALRLMAREMMLSLRVKTQYACDDYELTPIIAMSVIIPYLSPVLSSPETHKVLPNIIGALPRQNLSEVVKLLGCIACGHYRKIVHDVHLFAPLEQYIAEAVPGFSDWIIDIATVDDVESHLRTQDLVEVAAEPQPITLSRAEIYGVHGLLSSAVDEVAAGETDPVRKILEDLGGVPSVLYQEGQSAPVSLVLGTRFANVTDDPFAAQKADWSQAKRHVLATLKVQTGKTLIDVLTTAVYQEDEDYWLAVVQFDIESERAKRNKSHLPLPPLVANEYRLEDIRSLEFREVKARAIQYCMKIEKEGMLSRADNWQGLLDDIAADIRSKNKNRQRRRKDSAALTEALAHASEKKAALQEQLTSYNVYVTSAMNTMQKQGKKKFIMPFSKQGRHLRSMQKAGKKAQFGSYKYSAVELYEKHVILPISTFSPAQFSKLFVIISSNEVGVFDLEIVHPGSAQPVLGSCQVRMEDLLQAKYENKMTLDMFDQVAKVRVNTLIFLINKKFYT